MSENLKLSLAKMLKRLKALQYKDSIISPSEQQQPKHYSTTDRAVTAAFESSWQNLDSNTQSLGQLLSLFAPTVIPWELVERLLATSVQLSWTEADIEWVKKQLYQKHLIEPIKARKDYYTIHPLIRELLQAKLIASAQAEDFRRIFAQAMVGIAYQIPDSPSSKVVELLKDAIPHLEEVAQTLTSALSIEDLLWLFDRLGRFYESQGLYALAESRFIQCLLLAQCRLGNYHPDLAATLNNLGGFYYSQSRYSEAEPLYRKALALRKRLLGNHHLDVATTLNNLATLYYSQSRYHKAEPLYQQALALRKCLLGDEHLDVAATLNDLALVYYSQARYSEAESLYKKALAVRKRLLGNEHPDVATTLNNLAALYKSQRDYSKAEPLLSEAVEINERVLGDDHPNTVIFRKNLAILRGKTSTIASLWQRVFQSHKGIHSSCQLPVNGSEETRN